MNIKSGIFSITGVTITGNMGGQAMLLSSITQIRRRYPDSTINLFSIYPAKDAGENSIERLNIIDASPFKLVFLYLPLMFFLWPVRSFKIVKNILYKIAYFRHAFESDILLDHSGIAFVDGRGVSLLIYNVCCFLPGLFANIPVVKLSQALGPFNHLLNRTVARLSLKKCTKVIARGARSFEYLKCLNLSNVVQLPDVAFLLEVSSEDYTFARETMKRINLSGSPIIISPSRVVERLCYKSKINFVHEMTVLIRKLTETGESVLILPHSLGEGNDKNNDITLSRQLFSEAKCADLFILDDIRDARKLRALISLSRIFIGNRFHSIVSSLSERVPTIVIGWSHKYKELLKPFDMEEFAIEHTDFSGSGVFERYQYLKNNLDQIRLKLEATLPVIRKLAAENYYFLREDI